MAIEWSERAKNATKAELEAHLAYIQAQVALEEARKALAVKEWELRETHKNYQNAVLERNKALAEMVSGAGPTE